jgi:hypothetical protein
LKFRFRIAFWTAIDPVVFSSAKWGCFVAQHLSFLTASPAGGIIDVKTGFDAGD